MMSTQNFAARHFVQIIGRSLIVAGILAFTVSCADEQPQRSMQLQPADAQQVVATALPTNAPADNETPQAPVPAYSTAHAPTPYHFPAFGFAH